MPHLARHQEVVYTDLDDGAVLLHGETKFFYSLNQVGAAVWRSFASAETLDDLVDRLLMDYDVKPEHAKSALSTFVRLLEEEQLIVIDPAPSGARRSEEPQSPGLDDQLKPAAHKRPFVDPELIKHEEPLHAVVMNPFDPKLPLAE